jgi:hypothetical protein
MTATWVTLTVVESLPSAEIARGRLQVEGIACALVDRSLLQLGIVADGIELQVPVSQLERAREVLAWDYSGELE